jgi:simple sugar transport system ATP-binding protein
LNKRDELRQPSAPETRIAGLGAASPRSDTSGMASDHDALLEARGLTKSFGGVRAVDNAHLTVRRSEFVALVGDNGAGKSTLMKMLAGALTPDAGEIHMNGALADLGGPAAARTAGIETVWQDLALVKEMDTAANLYLGRELTYFGGRLTRLIAPLRTRQMRANSVAMLASLGIDISGSAQIPVGQLSGGQEQALAIARAVSWADQLLLLDEPTAALGVRQTKIVFDLCQRLRANGLAIVMITHSIPSILGIVDRIFVMRQGAVVAELGGRSARVEEVVAHIVGGTESAQGSDAGAAAADSD